MLSVLIQYLFVRPWVFEFSQEYLSTVCPRERKADFLFAGQLVGWLAVGCLLLRVLVVTRQWKASWLVQLKAKPTPDVHSTPSRLHHILYNPFSHQPFTFQDFFFNYCKNKHRIPTINNWSYKWNLPSHFTSSIYAPLALRPYLRATFLTFYSTLYL